MPDRSNEKPDDLDDGASPKDLEGKIALAMQYWSNQTSVLIPSLEQIQNLHFEMMNGYRSIIAGKIKEVPNFIPTEGGNLNFTSPKHVPSDYEKLVNHSHLLKQGLGPMPQENETLDINNPDHWPASDDDQSWINRALFIAHFHWRLIYIHPFDDGNGRTTRMVAWEQARRLFPDVYRLQWHAEPANDSGVRAVNTKDHYFYSSMNYSSAKAAYTEAIQNIRPPQPNLYYLASYFNFKEGLQLPFPLYSPFSFTPNVDNPI